MKRLVGINEYIHSLVSSERMSRIFVYHTILPGVPSGFSEPEKPWPESIKEMMHSYGVDRLYRHQSEVVNIIRSGRHVVMATPTASGKTLGYNLPVIENFMHYPGSKALYIFPLKALAQDQLKTFEDLASCGKGSNPSATIYDGDTSSRHRKRIREAPPNVILTNPEMIHLSFLAHHSRWASFLSDLELVVVDEVHTYRGIWGSHMAQVFRRFQRICTHYGSNPTFVLCSATIGNPAQLAKQLTGLDVKPVTASGAPRGKKHVVLLNPDSGTVNTVIMLLKAALIRGLRTIVYTQSRKLTELIAIWAANRSGDFADRISAYRAGFLPEERRDIEARLASGDLLAVISTSALELGIDIGDLDLCILAGYPGTSIATWQRSGRVGRSGQDSALILVAGEDALDQYFIRHPLELMTRPPEPAVVNQFNPEIMAKHLLCAAAELPIDINEAIMSEPEIKEEVFALEEKGKILKSADGSRFYPKRFSPHRHVNLRGTGSRFHIVCSKTGRNKGEIDGFRAFRETHPGAVYLHKGDTYLVDSLDPATKTVKVSAVGVDYYTKVRDYKETEILEIFEEKNAWGTTVYSGRLKVTERITGYEKHRMHVGKKLDTIDLNLPPLVFETEGLWLQIPRQVQQEAELKYYHFMGGIHAVEHAAIGIFPLLVMADRNDLGGISIPFHPQVDSAAIFIYDGVPGGVGLSRQAFKLAEELLEHTLDVIGSCLCETGCPSCVHSPKCGSGNRPIDKASALFLLGRIKTGQRPETIVRCRAKKENTTKPKDASIQSQNIHFGVFDIETQRSAKEVGGWHRADLMGISCAVLYDSKEDKFFEFLEDQVADLLDHLKKLDLVIGFNIKKFDYLVIRGYIDFDFRELATLDILEDVHKQLGYRLSLDNLAGVTLGTQKTADGLQALRWWKQGRIREIIDYCRKDVEITRDLFLYGKKKGYLLFKNKAEQNVRVPIDW